MRAKVFLKAVEIGIKNKFPHWHSINVGILGVAIADLLMERIQYELFHVQYHEENVDEVLKKWPHTAQFFRDYALACVGCTIAPFCEIGKVAEIYELPQEQFLNDLRAAIENKQAE